MSVQDYVVIALFSLLIFLVGLSFSRSGSSMKSYFAAGGALPWWLSGLSLFMSFFSAGTFVVWGSIAYEWGWVAISIQWMMGFGGFLIAIFLAPRWKKTNALTVGEYLGRQYGQNLKKFYSYIFIALSFLTTGAFLYPVAKLFNVASGFSIELSILILGLLIIIYTAAGGLWAVIITDVLQFVILFAAVFIVVPLSFDKIGGFASFVEDVPPNFFQLISGEYTGLFLLAFLLYNTLFIGGNWAYVQRYTSVQSASDAKKVGWLFGILYLVSPILWMLPPMIYRGMNGQLEGLENEGAFLLICKDVLPSGLLGLMLGGMIFATASSVNTTLNMSAAVFTNDLFQKIGLHAKKKNLMKAARVSTVVFGLITIGVALLIPSVGGIVEVVISIGAITGAPLFAPPIWSLFSKKLLGKDLMLSTLIGLSINLFFKFVSPWVLNFALDRAGEMLVGVLAPLLILAIFETYRYLLSENVDHSSFTHMVPSEKERSSNLTQNTFALRILGIALVLTGSLIVLLGILADTGRALVIFIGLVVAIVGSIFMYLNRADQPNPKYD